MTKTKQCAAVDRQAPQSLDRLTSWIKRHARVSDAHARTIAELVTANAAVAARR
jgi:hypothetical protein